MTVNLSVPGGGFVEVSQVWDSGGRPGRSKGSQEHAQVFFLILDVCSFLLRTIYAGSECYSSRAQDRKMKIFLNGNFGAALDLPILQVVLDRSGED